MTNAQLNPGVLPPGFEFRSLIAMGTGGWVVLARQTALQRDVAVKTVLLGAGSRPAVRRLEREGRVLAGLNHPGIVRIHQLMAHQAALFLVMEYLPGPNLESGLADGSLTIDQRLAVLTQVAAALTAVHSQHIAHRDVKPSNIVLHPLRGAVLLDFGLARLPVGRAAFRTALGNVSGTPRYMAPEQRDDPDAESPAIDAFAFGVLAHEVLLGRLPTDASFAGGRTVIDVRSYPQLPASAASALVQAVDRRPDRRLTPGQLIERLAPVPLASWPGQPPSRLGSVPVSAPTETQDLDPDSGAGADPDRPLHPPDTVDLDSRSPVGWVAPAVYRPRHQRRWLAVGVACLIGLLVGVVVAYLVLVR